MIENLHSITLCSFLCKGIEVKKRQVKILENGESRLCLLKTAMWKKNKQ
jgi:hypothetical protein